MSFDPTTVEGTRLKAEFIAKTWLPPIIEPSTCITPLFASTRPITENNGSSSIIHNSHDRESKTQERTTRSALDREEDEDDLEPSRKRRRRTCRRCRKPSCRGHKDIALCLEKPRIPCARCGGLESCPRGADEGRECSNADGGSSEPQTKQARIETKSQPRKRDVNAEKERRKSRTCRRCRKDTCKGYIDISLCPETPKVACIKCHRLDCLGGADGGRHCQN
ncbi:hypothetical protein BT69DRAFT_1285215 [Atractiella rhizophila]|nr:hypothetical protein BT69DRAFT_1285215 [Atractiella rhizophila]